MENDKQQQVHQQDNKQLHHHHHHQQEQEQQQQHHQEEEDKQDQKHQEEEEHQEQQPNNQEEEEKQQPIQQQQQQQQRHEEEEEESENKQNQAVSRSPISKRSIPKSQSPPPSDHSIDSPLSSDNSSLSHGFSPPPPNSSKSPPPPAAVSRADYFPSTSTATTTVVDVEEQQQQQQKLGSGKRLRPDLSILRRSKRDKMMRKALLGFRVSGFVFCLVSFSVLAADKDQGWALDSFYRYKEFRFCMAVNVIGFAYCGIQAYDLAYQLASGKHKPRSRLRCYLDFVFDQLLAYLLMSASSAAAVRVDDWQANWGKDKFPEMARASMAMSLVAFVAFALSSIVSGYTLCTFKSM